MKRVQKLIILNGFSGSGKTTIAKRYIKDNPIAINIEGDEIIAMMGEWKKYYYKARVCVFPHTKAMISTHLQLGYDVVVPYLVKNPKEVESFKRIAKQKNAKFFEIFLYTGKEKATTQLMERGKWGEKGLPKLKEKDLAHIKDLYSRMIKATAQRPDTIKIKVKRGDVEHTYKKLLEIIN